MSSTAALPRTWGGVLISLVILAGLFAMHGLAGSETASACHGAPGFAASAAPAADHPGTAALPASAMDPAGSAHHRPDSAGVVVEPVSAMEFAGATCVATLPRLVAVSNPLLIGFVALAALGGGLGYGSLQRCCRWDHRRAPPSSGVHVLRLKCVLRT
ncbi:hypothetical protein [Prescottella agglutinans]|uniref:hypothetical protein n=1 Tax=Prescottella agglutinans TaxID=1644129 RepID=UPI003D99FE9A